MQPITLIYTYYEDSTMLSIQLEAWRSYPCGYRIIVVDDGSPTRPAHRCLGKPRLPVEVYRVGVDIPWNSHGARNLGAQQCQSEWMLMADMDMVLTEVNARRLSRLHLDPGELYKFRTRTFGRRLRRPHKNTFLCTRKAFLESGGYDEDYSGTYGGDGDLVRRLRRTCSLKIPEHIHLRLLPRQWFTRVASEKWDPALYRSLYLQRSSEKLARNDTIPRNPIRFPWERML